MILTICSPWNQASGTVSHVKGPRWIGHLYGTKNTNNSRHTPFKSKLDLSFV